MARVGYIRSFGVMRVFRSALAVGRFFSFALLVLGGRGSPVFGYIPGIVAAVSAP